jgi:YHS domain-containing protein
MCKECGRILDLMISHSFAVDEEGKLTTYHFCSDEHIEVFAQRRGIPLSKD